MINSLLLKIKYKLYVSILFTSIPIVFACKFKFIARGPDPGNSPLNVSRDLCQYVCACVCYQHVLVVHKALLIALLFCCIYILYDTLVRLRSAVKCFAFPSSRGVRGVRFEQTPFERSLFNSNVFQKSSHKC